MEIDQFMDENTFTPQSSTEEVTLRNMQVSGHVKSDVEYFTEIDGYSDFSKATVRIA